ncbi:MAG: NAD(P)/FAD-dependent oxidoreductase [Leptolyngbyaceae bacterium]|nr:NAD(P)/FAD-dependent oxidoreductase [Leptolyngbyaceae bacterium]
MNETYDVDAIVIGSGLGGLTAGALLARYGWTVLVCESHSIPGGAAHSFSRRGFHFDSGPSFYCGLGTVGAVGQIPSLNPLRQVFRALEVDLETIPYDPLGHYHFPEGTLPVYGRGDRYQAEVAKFTTRGAAELADFERRLLPLYEGLSTIPTLAICPEFKGLPLLLGRYGGAMMRLLPLVGLMQGATGAVMDATVHDPFVRRLIDLECFLLSGLKAKDTVTPEMAFMFGERTRSVIDYPVGGSGAIAHALATGLEKWGGTLKLNAHVETINVRDNQAVGVTLRSGDVIHAPVVISNATVWDTLTHLLRPDDVPAAFRQRALATPAVESFMHLHLGIRSEGLDGLTGHHVVVHDAAKDITVPGNTCMISIPSVWDANLAPEGHHVVHAYTLEAFDGWHNDAGYGDRKRLKAAPLFRALEKVIPDVGDRITLELIGSPLTHARFLRRYKGTYGPAIAAGNGMFPGCRTPINGLYRVGDSTLPGIGVPAVAASGILCANTLVEPKQIKQLLNHLKL